MSFSYDARSTEVPQGLEAPVTSVVIVGAGMAGLTVANALTHAGVGCVVVEARSRIGGRTFTADLSGTPVDLGASWIHSPSENPLTALARGLGIDQVPWEAFDRSSAWDPDAGTVLSPSEFQALYERAESVVEELMESRALIGASRDREAIARSSPAMVGLDDQQRHRVASLVRLFVEAESSGRWEDVSMSWFPPNGLDLEGSPMGDVPVGGYRQYVQALADGLDIRTSKEVTAITVEQDGVRVTLRDGTSVSASHAVVTIPLGVLKAGAIAFEPPLPEPRLSAIDRLGFGQFDKVALRFERPFWTDAGINHVIVTPSSSDAPVHGLLGFDSAVQQPILIAFAFGSTHRWVHQELPELVDKALNLIDAVVPGDVPSPTAGLRSDWWRDPFTRGAYTFLAEGSSPEDLELLGQPHAGRVCFAGEATGHARVGFVDGALDTGVREAKRLTGRPVVEIGRLAER